MPNDLEQPPVEHALICVHELRPILDQIANKWSVMILTVICEKPVRFNQLLRRLEGITHKALAEALRRLERNGLVSRHVLPTSPVGVEYAITPLGQTLREPFEALNRWSLKHGPDLERAQQNYDRERETA